MVRGDRWSTVRMSAGYEKGQTLQDCLRRFVHAKSLSKNVANAAEGGDQEVCRMQVCRKIIERLQTETDLLRSVITGEWTLSTIRKPSARSVSGKSTMSSRPKKARESKSNVKAMLVAFFDVRGIVRSEFV